VFKEPVRVMRNFEKVTRHLRRRLEAAAESDIDRKVLTLVPNDRGESFSLVGGEVWRLVGYVANTASYNVVDEAKKAYEAGRAFGRFQELLADLPGTELEETIPNFHHTPRRLEALRKACQQDFHGRFREAEPEIEYALAQGSGIGRVTGGLDSGLIPNRITHNDTKLNNVLLDNNSGEAVCVIDLDTVMPGSILYDFGDLIRTATNTGAEDEQNLSRVAVHMGNFEAVARGYLSIAHSFLTPQETDLLPHSGFLLAYENGIRFLTDHLNGDIYFKIHRNRHNLERARAQFKLAESFQSAEGRMKRIVAEAIRAAR
jgi:Ser/Thr protein kinase RdoA (MazF antagonist)